MTTTNATIIEKAKELGGNSADAYFEEFEISPSNDGIYKVGDWDSSAWANAWHELRDQGAAYTDYSACLDAWKEGFWA